MARRGLNETGRGRIRSLVKGAATGDRVRKEIDVNVQSREFDYDKNLDLVSWLRDSGYQGTADHLAKYLKG